MGIRIPKGLYDTEGTSGYPVILAYNTDVMDAIGLSSQAGVTEAVSNYEIDADTVGLRIPSGLYQTAGNSGYPVIKEKKIDLSWIVNPQVAFSEDNTTSAAATSKSMYVGQVFLMMAFVTRTAGIDTFYFSAESVSGSHQVLYTNEFKIKDAYGTTAARGIVVIVRCVSNGTYQIDWGSGTGRTVTYRTIRLV